MSEFFNIGCSRGMNTTRKNKPPSKFDKLYENLCNFCNEAVKIMNKFKEKSIKKGGDKKHFGNGVVMAMAAMFIDLKKIMDSEKEVTHGMPRFLISKLFSISKELKNLIETKKKYNKEIKEGIYNIKETINNNITLTAIIGRESKNSIEIKLIENYKMIMNDYLEKIEDGII